jgi:alanine dehydrogenase
MAARFYGVAQGGKLAKDVTEALTTNSAQYEFQIANTTATSASKQEALLALEAIKQYIIGDTWPPA